MMTTTMKIYFLISSERSGSNFLTKVLDSHSDICGPSIKHIINPLAQNLFRYKDPGNKINRDALIEDLHALLSTGFSAWKTRHTIESLHEMFDDTNIAGLIKNIFAAEAEAHGKKNIFIKENHIYRFLPFLLLNFPEAMYVYNIRDPRDVALSWKNNPTHKGGIIAAARQWQKDQVKSLQIFSVLQPLNRMHLIRYEDLVTNTEDTLKTLCEFMGLDFEHGMLDFHTDKLTRENSGLDVAWRNLSSPVIKNNIGKYKAALSKKEIAYIEKICYLEMRWFGYEIHTPKEELDAIPPGEISAYHENEINTLPHEQRESLVDIMKAKAVFYNRDPRVD